MHLAFMMERRIKGEGGRVGYPLKRALDVTLALVTLALLSPVLAFIALIVMLRLGRPILFRQMRPGLHGKPFVLYKFRTMREMYNDWGYPLSDEQRVTRLGRFLRATSLDELPEVINVLKGEMSLVGPRPLLMRYLELYTPEQTRRLDVLPGITGWAQVHGRNAVSYEETFALDVWYVDHQSLRLDLYIIAMTIWKIVRREGTMDRKEIWELEEWTMAGDCKKPQGLGKPGGYRSMGRMTNREATVGTKRGVSGDLASQADETLESNEVNRGADSSRANCLGTKSAPPGQTLCTTETIEANALHHITAAK